MTQIPQHLIVIYFGDFTAWDVVDGLWVFLSDKHQMLEFFLGLIALFPEEWHVFRVFLAVVASSNSRIGWRSSGQRLFHGWFCVALLWFTLPWTHWASFRLERKNLLMHRCTVYKLYTQRVYTTKEYHSSRITFTMMKKIQHKTESAVSCVIHIARPLWDSIMKAYKFEDINLHCQQ